MSKSKRIFSVIFACLTVPTTLFAAPKKTQAAQLIAAREYVQSQFRQAKTVGRPTPTEAAILKVLITNNQLKKSALKEAYNECTKATPNKKNGDKKEAATKKKGK